MLSGYRGKAQDLNCEIISTKVYKRFLLSATKPETLNLPKGPWLLRPFGPRCSRPSSLDGVGGLSVRELGILKFGFRVFRVQGLGFQGSGFRVWGLGVRVWGSVRGLRAFGL